jgi:ABC-type glycerol-3-phosphate transport system substrate-binding protein
VRHLRKFSALLAVMALLAACGGGASGGDDTTSTTAVTGGDATTTTAAQTTTTQAQATTTAGGDDGEAFLEACQGAGQMGETLDSAGGSMPEEIDWLDAAQKMKDAARFAPAEIRDDYELVADAMSKYFELMAEIDWQPGQMPTEDQIKKMEEAANAMGEIMDNDELEAAMERITAWFEEHCGGV